MSILFMTKYEREVLYKILEDRSKFWVYGEQEACFEDDVKSLILQGMRNTRKRRQKEILGIIDKRIEEWKQKDSIGMYLRGEFLHELKEIKKAVIKFSKCERYINNQG